MKKDDLVIVDAPSKYANSTLNGSLAKVNFVDDEVVNVTFVSGVMMGREWQMCPTHVRLANKSMRLTAFGAGVRRLIAKNLVALAGVISPDGGR